MKYLLIFILVVMNACSEERDIHEKKKIDCFEKTEKVITDPQISSFNFKNLINCFSWDSISGISYLYRDREDVMSLNYKIIDYKENGKFAYPRFRSDQDNNGGWVYIYFYEKGKLIDNALAIHLRILDFRDVKGIDLRKDILKVIDTVNSFYSKDMKKVYSYTATVK